MRAPVVDYQLPVEPEPRPVIGLQPEQVAARFGRFEFPCPCYLVILYVDIVGGRYQSQSKSTTGSMRSERTAPSQSDWWV